MGVCMKALRFLLPVVAFVLLVGAAPKQSGYTSVPQKKEQWGANDEPREIRDGTVNPEEVYKHGVQEVAIVATDTGFLPARIYVRKNIPVHLFLTSASPSKLCFIMDDFSIRKGVSIQQVDQVNFLPTRAGEYRFYCPVQEIKGSVVVRD